MPAYALIRSQRKTVALHIRGGALEVRAPLKMPKADIERFIASKDKWISDKLAQSREKKAQRESFKPDYGCVLLYRGGFYPVLSSDIAMREESVFTVLPGLSPERIKAECVQIYKQAAEHIFTEKTVALAKAVGVKHQKVRISSAKTRWGSCSAIGNLNFSWRLIMAPDDVIDYVIVHELAHLREMNHSKRFWSVVESVLPDYRERRKKLSELQDRLSCEDWE